MREKMVDDLGKVEVVEEAERECTYGGGARRAEEDRTYILI